MKSRQSVLNFLVFSGEKLNSFKSICAPAPISSLRKSCKLPLSINQSFFSILLVLQRQPLNPFCRLGPTIWEKGIKQKWDQRSITLEKSQIVLKYGHNIGKKWSLQCISASVLFETKHSNELFLGFFDLLKLDFLMNDQTSKALSAMGQSSTFLVWQSLKDSNNFKIWNSHSTVMLPHEAKNKIDSKVTLGHWNGYLMVLIFKF